MRQKVLVPLVLGTAVIVSGCGIVAKPTVRQHGYVETEERLASVEQDLRTKNEVLDRLGSPSTISTFEPETWYYVSKRTSQLTWHHPETQERSVTAITFGAGDQVQSVSTYGLEDGQEIALVGRKTETRGRRLGFFEQMFGNLGRLPGALGGGEEGQ
ncbi:MAG: outer membrane protein assembly factor BamE [Pseudomonadota bacterium]